MPLVSEAVAAVLQPRIDVVMSPDAYIDLQAAWTGASTDAVHLEVLIWTICRKPSKGCIAATTGTVSFDPGSLTVSIIPPQQNSWHRVAQLQAAVVPEAFKTNFVVGA